MPIGTAIVSTNFIDGECPYQVDYDPTNDKVTATVEWVCRVGRGYFSPGWGFERLTTSFDCANSLDEVTVYHSNFGQFHPERQNFLLSCFNAKSSDASYFTNFNVHELLNLRYTKLISSLVFDKLEGICSCRPEDVALFDSNENNNEELEENHLFNPSNIALGIGATCLAAFGAYKAYQYLRSEKQIPFVEMDLPSNDEDYISKEANTPSTLRHRT